MLFGDAARMTALHVNAKSDSAVHATAPTQANLGPGSYFTAHNENIRGGWIKRSFSTRQPMLAGDTRRDRSHHYTAGVLINGTIAQGGSQSNNTPGPGYYNTSPPATAANIMRRGTGTFKSFNSQNASMMSGGGMRTTSSRMLLPSASLKNGILFHGKIDDHSHIGPGHYHNAEQNNMIKRSFNARVSSPQRRPGSAQSPSLQGGSRLEGRFSPSQSASYSGMYSPRYSGRAVYDSPEYIPAGEIDASRVYDEEQQQQGQEGGYEQENEEHEDFFSQMQDYSPSLAPETAFTSAEKKKGRNPGRMTMLESTVPKMFRAK